MIKWTEAELEGLKNGIIPSNRSANSIKIMKNKLGLVAFKKPVWTPEHKAKLRELLAEGKTTREIAEILPYTQRSIQKEIVRQKLPHQTMVRFTGMEKIFFKKFLTENCAGKSVKELVDLWNSSNKRKINDRKVVVYLKKLNLKMPKIEAIKLAWSKKQEEEWLEKGDADSIKERRIQIMAARFDQNLDIWTGMPLAEEKPNMLSDD